MLKETEWKMKNDNNWCYYLVASVDVLGQKEAFKGIDDLPTDKKSEEKLIEAHKDTVLFIEAFREGFGNIFSAYVEESESKLKVPEEKKAKFEEMRKCILKHQFFSDSILAYVPLETEKYHINAVNGVYGILAACGGMLLITLAEKKVFRAGIDVGIGTELKNGDVYGPALIKAYKLESEDAQYPRIVIGKKFLNYLKSLSQKCQQFPDQDKDDIEACKIKADSCLNMIVTDLDGYQMLDYLGEEFRSRFFNFPTQDETISFEEIFEKAHDFVESEYKKRRDAGDSELALRYYLLHNYFRARSFKVGGNHGQR